MYYRCWLKICSTSLQAALSSSCCFQYSVTASPATVPVVLIDIVINQEADYKS